MSPKKVMLELTADEALVFYDWLTRFNQQDTTAFADQAEERILFDLEALLEQTLVAPFEADYAVRVAQARVKVRDTCA